MQPPPLSNSKTFSKGYLTPISSPSTFPPAPELLWVSQVCLCWTSHITAIFYGVSIQKYIQCGSLGGIVVKNLPANAGDARDTGLIPGSGRFPGVGNITSLQYPCLENSMSRGAWWATVHGTTKSQTQPGTHNVYSSQKAETAQRSINGWWQNVYPWGGAEFSHKK